MRFSLKGFMVISLVSIIPFTNYAQHHLLINSTLDGQVIDADNKNPLIGVTLKIKGTAAFRK